MKRFDFNLTHALVLSTLVHLVSVSPVDRYFHAMYFPERPEEEETQRIEFEFFQAAPREAKDLFLPRGDEVPEPERPADPEALTIPAESIEIPDPGLDWEPPEPEPLEPVPSLEEQTEIREIEEKTTDSLATEVELEELETTETIKWDYCNRIRTLIDAHVSLPEILARRFISDIVKVEISLDRQGRLIKNTPRILPAESSRYSEINQAALDGVRRAARFFPPIPERFPEDEITFWVPIRFTSPGMDSKK
jgi:TonB family protein